MIKVNLLRNQGSVNSEQVEFELTTETGSAQDQKDAAIKIIIMFLAVICLYMYESMNLSDLADRERSVTRRLNELQAEVDKYGDVAGEAKKQQRQKAILERKIEAVKVLSKSRLQVIKSLDFVQNVIPENVWLVQVEVKQSVMTIQGNALSSDSAREFLKRLEEKTGYFKTVLLRDTKTVTVDKRTVVGFRITADLKDTE